MRGALFVGLTIAILGLTLPASAFLLVATDGGVPTHWRQQCVPWKVSERASDHLSVDEIHEVVTQAFGAWEAVDESFIRFEDHGSTSLESVSLEHGVGENIVVWHGEGQWPYALHVVGLTSLTYDTDTGQIMDADIEMNGDDYRFAINGSPDSYDAQQSLTHEIGHLLGLDHSVDTDAVMFAESQPGETHKRVLKPDDIEGLKFNHPVSATPDVDGCLTPAVIAPPAESGCSTGSSSSPVLVVCFLVGLWLWRRRPFAQVLPLGLALSLMCISGVRAGTPYVTEDGVPIYWPENTMLYTLHPDLPEELELNAVETAIGRGFDAWETLECQPLTLDLAGWDGCVGEDSEDGINCIRWRNREEVWAWPGHLVAVTLVHYWEDTGAIEDVDMEINAFNTSWSTSLECEPDLHDLIATITHEAGHFVGLDHSQDGQATMNAATTTGDCQKRSLEVDDKDTFCETYGSRPELTEEPDSDIARVDLDAQGSPDAADPDAADPDAPPSSRGGCQGCSGSPMGGWLALLSITAWLVSRRRPH